MSNPTCPVCKKEMKHIVYGMPSRLPTEEDDWISGGCTQDFMFGEEYVCPECDEYVYVEEDTVEGMTEEN